MERASAAVSVRREVDSDVLDHLERLDAQLPALSCLGLCEQSCHEHIDASAAERARPLKRGVDLDFPTTDGACPALSRTFGVGRCTVHEVRPMICRLWGRRARCHARTGVCPRVVGSVTGRPCGGCCRVSTSADMPALRRK